MSAKYEEEQSNKNKLQQDIEDLKKYYGSRLAEVPEAIKQIGEFDNYNNNNNNNCGFLYSAHVRHSVTILAL